MRTDLLIVTYAKDFPYLRYCLRSIKKFAKGFGGVTIMVPAQDMKALVNLIDEEKADFVRPIWGDEWQGKGMLWHEYMILMGDALCDQADYVAHFDPDCVFTQEFHADQLFKDGKPIIQYERFDSIGRRHPGVLEWQRVTEKCLPFPIEFETMRQLPSTYHRQLYNKCRQLIFNRTGLSASEYIRLQKNSFPQSFCEFVTLGNVAMVEFPDRYSLSDRSKQENPDRGLFPVFQAWSHNPPDVVSDLWIDGKQHMVTALSVFEKLGLT